MKGSRNEDWKDRKKKTKKKREERKQPRGRDGHGEEDLFSK